MRLLFFVGPMLVAAAASAQWLNYPTAGIPRGPDGKTNLSAPAPRTQDGKPDLAGVWQAESQEYFFDLAAGLKPDALSMQPWAKALQQHLFRQIFLDGRKLAGDVNPTWLGYSTGKWVGDTLVVETSGFNDQTWLDTSKGHPATTALHVTERFRRKDFGNLEVEATIDDPKAYTKPWTTTAQKVHLQLNTDILEFVCNENEKDVQHVPVH